MIVQMRKSRHAPGAEFCDFMKPAPDGEERGRP